MAHDRHAALGQIFDRRRHGGAAFDLHRLGARLLHDPHGVGVGGLGRALVRAERHVDHDHGLARAAHDRLTVQDHHLHGHADGVGQAMHHHAQRVADQQQVAGVIQGRRDRRGVGGQADDGHAALAGGDVGGGETADRLFTMRGQNHAPKLQRATAAFVGQIAPHRNMNSDQSPRPWSEVFHHPGHGEASARQGQTRRQPQRFDAGGRGSDLGQLAHRHVSSALRSRVPLCDRVCRTPRRSGS
jgi:hypothetical protein